MNIKMRKEADCATLYLEGRLDTTAAPAAERAMRKVAEEHQRLVIDFEQLQYITSAGLRVLLILQKIMMAKSGQLLLKNLNPQVMEVLEMTGFAGILSIS